MAKKITSLEDLKAVRERAQGAVDLRGAAKEMKITVHLGTCGIAAGARDVLGALMAELDKAGASSVLLTQAGCAGLCDREPMLTLVDKDGRVFRYGSLDKAKAREIVREHVVRGNPVTEHLIRQ